MEIEYELGLDDLLAQARHYRRTSQRIRHTYWRSLLIGPLFGALAMLVLSGDALTAAIIGLGSCCLITAVIMYVFHRGVYREYTKQFAEGKNLAWLGIQKMPVEAGLYRQNLAIDRPAITLGRRREDRADG